MTKTELLGFKLSNTKSHQSFLYFVNYYRIHSVARYTSNITYFANVIRRRSSEFTEYESYSAFQWIQQQKLLLHLYLMVVAKLFVSTCQPSCLRKPKLRSHNNSQRYAYLRAVLHFITFKHIPRYKVTENWAPSFQKIVST